MVDLTTRMVSMETVCREVMIFMEILMVKYGLEILCGVYGENMADQIS